MNFTKETGFFPSSGGEYSIAYYIYTPETPPRAIVQIAHGMCEYAQRYEDFISYLCGNGILVCADDHIGHGKSVNTADDLGYFGKKPADGVFADDEKILYDIIRRKYRRLPFIMFGHSMGSFICRDYISKYADTLDGAVICGTAGPNRAVGAGIFLSKLLGRIRGGRYRSRILKNSAFKSYNSHFPGEGESAWLTRDTEVHRKYDGDPLCGFNFTAYGYRDMLTLLKRVNSPGWAESVPQSLPVLLISGGNDPVGDYGKGVNEVRFMLENRELCNLTAKLYPECRHEILNELNRDEVYRDILEWVNTTAEGAVECRTLY